jgi:hypothetical protein
MTSSVTKVRCAVNRRDLSMGRYSRARLFGVHDVPSTLMGVTVLGYKDQLVEIEAVAAVLDAPSR